MEFLIVIIIVVGIISLIYSIWEVITRPQRWNETIEELYKMKAKIIYMNQSTGRITYVHNGKKHSISIYKGYNNKGKDY